MAQRTYIKLPYLEALEEGRMEALPAPVYTYGYIRQYAKLLGLDGGDLVARFQQHEGGGASPRSGSAPQRSLPPMPEMSGDPTSSYRPANGRSNGSGYRAGAGFSDALATVSGGESPEVQQAKQQAQQILAAAEREAQQMVRGAEQYAAEVLSNLEVEVAKALQIIQNGRHYLATRRPNGPKGH